MSRAELLGNPLPPLRFRRSVLPKVWGGRALARRFGFASEGEPIGETWELCDRDEHPSYVAEGPLEGVSLRELMQQRAADLLGRARAGTDGRFPLLVKFLDAAEPLSVQVHPACDDAQRGEEAKTEAWLFLAPEDDEAASPSPRGRVWFGARAGTTREQLERARGRDVLELLNEWPVRAGECLLVPGGSLHAIGAHVQLLEVQQCSDTTHRLWDWDRVGLDGRPRTLHRDEALRVVRLEPVDGPRAPRFTRLAPNVQRAELVDTQHFALERFELDAHAVHDDHCGRVARIAIVLAGEGRLATEHGDVRLRHGDVWLLPASLGSYRFEALAAPLSLARVSTKEST